MAKPMAAFIISVAFASNDVLSDDGLSLLQMRVAKHHVQEPNTLADGSVLEIRAGGTLCEPDEVITFAKCNEAQKRGVLPGINMGPWRDIQHTRSQHPAHRLFQTRRQHVLQ